VDSVRVGMEGKLRGACCGSYSGRPSVGRLLCGAKAADVVARNGSIAVCRLNPGERPRPTSTRYPSMQPYDREPARPHGPPPAAETMPEVLFHHVTHP